VALYDQHLHTWFSSDSETNPAENVRQAAELGLAGLTFTDHFDTHPVEWPVCRYEYNGIARAVRKLRAEYGNRIHIGHGIEVCYQPEQMGRILPFVESHRFDVVILSVHWAAGRAMHLSEQWGEWDIAAATQAYLETVVEAVRFVGELARTGRRPFDVLGHLDMVKRYTQRFRGGFDVRQHGELVDQILQGCLQCGLTPEVNTSTLRQGLTETMPADWVIRRYAELGGQAMSLGSDAHRPEQVGGHFETAVSQFKENGIRQLAVFADRQRRCEPL
jgi:histidinol-phosphatase (PHP family)